MSKYAWIITIDHLCEYHEKGSDWDAVDTTGPSSAPNELLVQLKDGKGHVFYMRDDDGELYYTGRFITNRDIGDSDFGGDYCERPLYDFGGPGAGCTLIKYHGKPEWNCEY